MTRLLDIFTEAMSHPAGSADREAGLAHLGEAIKAQAQGEACQWKVADGWSTWPGRSDDWGLDWAKRAANDTDWD